MAVGALREDFFAETMNQAGHAYSYLKNNRGAKTPDFLLQDDAEKVVVEIGGRGKGRAETGGNGSSSVKQIQRLIRKLSCDKL